MSSTEDTKSNISHGGGDDDSSLQRMPAQTTQSKVLNIVKKNEEQQLLEKESEISCVPSAGMISLHDQNLLLDIYFIRISS